MINKGKIILEAYEHFMAVLFSNSQALNAEEVFLQQNGEPVVFWYEGTLTLDNWNEQPHVNMWESQDTQKRPDTEKGWQCGSTCVKFKGGQCQFAASRQV